MKLVDAVNRILPFLGERPVPGTTDPTVVANASAAKCVQYIDDQRLTLLAEGDWYNTAKNISLQPDADRKITVPSGFLSFVPCERRNLTQMGGFLYDLDNATPYFDEPVKITAKLDLVFEDLPRSVADYITWTAALLVYGSELGVDSNVQLMTGYQNAAATKMLQEKLRNRKYNSLRSHAGWELLTMTGPRYVGD